MSGFGYGGYGGLGPIGFILDLVIAVGIIVAVVVLIVWLARRLGRGSGSSPYTDSAVLKPSDILQVRYARGRSRGISTKKCCPIWASRAEDSWM